MSTNWGVHLEAENEIMWTKRRSSLFFSSDENSGGDASSALCAVPSVPGSPISPLYTPNI